MSVYKKSVLIVLGILDVFAIVMMIGYIKWGIDMPDVLAGREVTFMGAYILALTYFAVALIVSTIFLVCLLKWRKHEGRK